MPKRKLLNDDIKRQIRGEENKFQDWRRKGKQILTGRERGTTGLAGNRTQHARERKQDSNLSSELVLLSMVCSIPNTPPQRTKWISWRGQYRCTSTCFSLVTSSGAFFVRRLCYHTGLWCPVVSRVLVRWRAFSTSMFLLPFQEFCFGAWCGYRLLLTFEQREELSIRAFTPWLSRIITKCGVAWAGESILTISGTVLDSKVPGSV